MAEIPKTGVPSYSSVTPHQASTIVGLLAGEEIAAGDACRIDAPTGRVYRASGAAAGANARVAGFSFVPASAGDAVTLVTDGNFRYAAALTPGALYFLSGTIAGGIADTASTGGTKAVGYALDTTRIRILPAGLM